MLGRRYTTPLLDAYGIPSLMRRIEPVESYKKPRKTRSDKGKVYINERDLVGLHFIGEQYFATIDQLGFVLNLDAPLSVVAVRRVVERWVRAGLVKTWDLLASYEPLVYLSQKGLKELNLPYTLWTPKLEGLEHKYDLNRVRLYIEKNGWGKWYSERYIRKQDIHSVMIGGHKHYPDSVIEYPNKRGLKMVVEYERTPKEFDRVREIMLSYLDTNEYTLAYFTTEATASLISRVRETLPVNKLKLLETFRLEDTPDPRAAARPTSRAKANE
jgi:hypothetical protein